MNEKINKIDEEIKIISQKRKDYNRKADEKIKMLQGKIVELQQQQTAKENKMIVEAVRDIYGDVTEETIEMFRESMREISFKRNTANAEADAV